MAKEDVVDEDIEEEYVVDEIVGDEVLSDEDVVDEDVMDEDVADEDVADEKVEVILLKVVWDLTDDQRVDVGSFSRGRSTRGDQGVYWGAP